MALHAGNQPIHPFGGKAMVMPFVMDTYRGIFCQSDTQVWLNTRIGTATTAGESGYPNTSQFISLFKKSFGQTRYSIKNKLCNNSAQPFFYFQQRETLAKAK
jgi:hypothetical protein